MIERIDCGKSMSRAVKHNGLIYFSGHAAAGKQTTIQEQTQALLNRFEELLKLHGSDKDHILSATIYITDMSLKPAMNEVWDVWLNPGCAPVRVCVEVVLEPGYLLEISLIAELL